jgi:hypothetical protein
MSPVRRASDVSPWTTSTFPTAGSPSPDTKTALGTGPVSAEYLKRHLLHQGVYLERIRGDRVLHEALTVGADPLHLALVFNLSHTAASRYATIAQNLLDDQTGVRRDAVKRESGRSWRLPVRGSPTERRWRSRQKKPARLLPRNCR